MMLSRTKPTIPRQFQVNHRDEQWSEMVQQSVEHKKCHEEERGDDEEECETT